MRIRMLSLLMFAVVASVSAQTRDTVQKPSVPTSEADAAKQTPVDAVAQLREQIDAATAGPERNTLRFKLVEELIAANKKTEALSELRSLTITDVFDPQGFYNAGNALARLGDNDGAIQAYRKAIEQRKGNYSRALNNLGVVLLRTGRWDESYEALISALKIEGFRYAEASYNLGRLYSARGENDMAVREWRRALALNPHHTAAAEALAHIGEEGRVTMESARVTTARPSSSSRVNKVATSNSTSTRSLVLDAASFELLQHARTQTEKGKTAEAIENYKRLLSRQGGYFAPANLELGFALVNSKRYDEAVETFQMVATRDGNRYPISCYHLGRLYENGGDLKQAEIWFSQVAASFGKKNAQFFLDVSRVREKQGNFRGALEAMETYLSLIGEQPSWSTERLTALRAKMEKN